MVRAWRFFSLCIIVVLLILSQSALASQEPVVSELAKTLKEDKTTVITLRGKSPLHKKLSYSIVQSPKHGSVIIKGNKARYTPQVDYFGLDDFLYQASDGTLTSIAANVKLTVTSVNDTPIAMAQTAIVGKGVSSVITLTARDIDGDPLAYKITSKPKKGSVNITGNLVTYTPKKADFQGKDSFTFKVNDGKKSSKPARLDLTISSAKQGKFIDACVSGLGFKTSSGIQGLTNQNCEYFFEDGDTIEFFVGNTKIASLPAKSLTSVLEVENSAQAAMFLQSLDSDKNPENGISIPDDTHTLLEKNTLTLEEVNPDDLAFIQKYKAITNKDFITNEVDALAHAESALKLELAKDMDWYPYYTGQVDIYKTLEPADEEYFLNNFRPRLSLYFYNYLVFPSLQVDSVRSYEKYTIGEKQNEYIKEFTKKISDTLMYISIGVDEWGHFNKGNIFSLDEQFFTIVENSVGLGLEYTESLIREETDNFLERTLMRMVIEEAKLINECKDVIADIEYKGQLKIFDPLQEKIKKNIAYVNCSAAIANKFATTFFDAKTAYISYSSSTAINTNIVVRAYLYEYYRTGGSDAAVKYKYGSYGPYSGIAAVIQGVAIKELSQESHVFGMPVNVGSDIDMEKAIEKINDYKARVSNAVTNITKTFDLKNKPAEKLVESVSVDIVNGKTSVADGGHKLHVCYQVKNNAYFYISNVKLDFGFVEYDSGAKIFTKLESLNMNELAPRSNEEQCHYLSVPDSFLQNPEENSRILLFRATYGNNIEISDTQIINFAAQNDIKEIIDQFLDPTVIATASGAIDGIIYLDASGSSVHKSQGTLSFVWEQIPTLNAPKIAINDANSDKASINVPSLPPNQTQQSLAFKVKATASVSQITLFPEQLEGSPTDCELDEWPDPLVEPLS